MTRVWSVRQGAGGGGVGWGRGLFWKNLCFCIKGTDVAATTTSHFFLLCTWIESLEWQPLAFSNQERQPERTTEIHSSGYCCAAEQTLESPETSFCEKNTPPPLFKPLFVRYSTVTCSQPLFRYLWAIVLAPPTLYSLLCNRIIHPINCM